jgi:hypothetical protein
MYGNTKAALVSILRLESLIYTSQRYQEIPSQEPSGLSRPYFHPWLGQIRLMQPFVEKIRVGKFSTVMIPHHLFLLKTS